VPPGEFRARAIGVRDQDDRFFRVVHDTVGQIGLIVGNELHAVRAGNVRRGHDDVLVPRNRGIEPDLLDATARDGAADGDAVKHARRRHVVDVERLAGDFRAAFLAPDRAADLGDLHLRDLIA
jgi:hypothetical protein